MPSTDTCLSYLSDNIIQGFENGMFTGMILIDLQKAFDTIDHDNFLRKMKHLAFPIQPYIRSYLTSQTFFVNIAKETSSTGDSTMWTSTRLYPWPLIFLSYVNDMPQAVDCDLLFLTQMTPVLYSEMMTIHQIEKQLNQNFNSLCDWFVDKKLSIYFGERQDKVHTFWQKK